MDQTKVSFNQRKQSIQNQEHQKMKSLKYQGEQVVLSFACKNLKNLDMLSKTDPQVRIFTKQKEHDDWRLKAKTEIIWDELNPSFQKAITLFFKFEKKQRVKFVVIDMDNEKIDKFDVLGSVETTLSKVVGGWQNPFVKELLNHDRKKNGTLVVHYEKVQEINEMWTMKPCIEEVKSKRFFFRPNPYLKFYKPGSWIQKGVFDEPWKIDDWVLVHQTKVALYGNGRAEYKEFTRNSFQITRNDYDMPLKVSKYEMLKGSENKVWINFLA